MFENFLPLPYKIGKDLLQIEFEIGSGALSKPLIERAVSLYTVKQHNNAGGNLVQHKLLSKSEKGNSSIKPHESLQILPKQVTDTASPRSSP